MVGHKSRTSSFVAAFRSSNLRNSFHRMLAGPYIPNCVVQTPPVYILFGVPQQLTVVCKDMGLSTVIACQPEWTEGLSLGVSPNIELHMLGAYCLPLPSSPIVVEFRLDGTVDNTATLTGYFKGNIIFSVSSIDVISLPARWLWVLSSLPGLVGVAPSDCDVLPIFRLCLHLLPLLLDRRGAEYHAQRLRIPIMIN